MNDPATDAQRGARMHPVLAGCLTVMVLLLLYAGSYFAVIVMPYHWRLPKWTPPTPSVIVGGSLELQGGYIDLDGSWEVFPDYHGIPEKFYRPMHALDRDWL